MSTLKSSTRTFFSLILYVDSACFPTPLPRAAGTNILSSSYYALDPDVFRAQLADWNNLSFSVLSSAGPQGLPPDLRVFPALLFQVLAMALLVLTDEPHEFYDHLKYAGNMTFEDLSSDYSDSGVGTLTLLGKRQITLTAV